MLTALWLLTLPVAQAEDISAILSADHVTWAGLDYSRVSMVSITDFRDPDAIFPGYLDKWNGLFIVELIDDLSAALGKDVRTDTEGVTAINQAASPDQIHRKAADSIWVSSPQLQESDIRAMVSAYDLNVVSGVGLAFQMESLLKEQQQGCLFVTFFDIASREVLWSERTCEDVGGFGFRNYYFRPPKSAALGLKDTVKRWKKAAKKAARGKW